MRDKENISKVTKLAIHMIGFNFYKPSSRYIASYNEEALSSIPDNIKRVGVFVQSPMAELLDIANQYKLDYIQLHGDEDLDFCRDLKKHYKLIKVFRIDDDFDFTDIEPFHSVSDYFLFDTKTKSYGGSGKQFSWAKLQNYQGPTPYFLSGGIGPEDADDINAFQHQSLVGIDINSCFEIAPAIKDTHAIETFISTLNRDKREI